MSVRFTTGRCTFQFLHPPANTLALGIVIIFLRTRLVLRYIALLDLAMDTNKSTFYTNSLLGGRYVASRRSLSEACQAIFPRFCCPEHAVLFPEFFVKGKTGVEAIDFFLESKKWDIELLRNRNRLVEHMERFQEGGAGV